MKIKARILPDYRVKTEAQKPAAAGSSYLGGRKKGKRQNDYHNQGKKASITISITSSFE